MFNKDAKIIRWGNNNFLTNDSKTIEFPGL